MYTALAIERELRRRSIAADFRATGQTGILIVGAGVSVDAVISDFVAAAAASLSPAAAPDRSEEHTSELQSLMRISYAVFCLKKKKKQQRNKRSNITETMNVKTKNK